jgi:hypothetical protein
VYSKAQIDELVGLYLGGADRDKLDPILDVCVAVYKEQLGEDGQVDFKGKAKAFLRAYGFLSSILPYTNADWEKLSIFLNFLVSKLPAPVEEDLSKGILEAIDMDSYRVEKKAVVKIQLPDADAEIEPVPTTGGGYNPEPELDRLSNILKVFNDQFGNIPWNDADRVHKLITEEIPARVAADTAYQNAKQNSDKQNARIEHDKALARVMTAVLKDDTELFKQFMDNDGFRRWLTDTVFGLGVLHACSRRCVNAAASRDAASIRSTGSRKIPLGAPSFTTCALDKLPGYKPAKRATGKAGNRQSGQSLQRRTVCHLLSALPAMLRARLTNSGLLSSTLSAEARMPGTRLAALRSERRASPVPHRMRGSGRRSDGLPRAWVQVVSRSGPPRKGMRDPPKTDQRRASGAHASGDSRNRTDGQRKRHPWTCARKWPCIIERWTRSSISARCTLWSGCAPATDVPEASYSMSLSHSASSRNRRS